MKKEFLQEFRERAHSRTFWREANDMHAKLKALPAAERAEVCAELSDTRESVETRQFLAWTLPLEPATASIQRKLLRDPSPAVRHSMTKFERKRKKPDDAFVAEGLASLDAYNAMYHDDAPQWDAAALDHMLVSGDLLQAWVAAQRLLDTCEKEGNKWPAALTVRMEKVARMSPCAGAAMSMALWPCKADEARTMLAHIASAAGIDAINLLRDLAHQPQASSLVDHDGYVALTQDALGHAEKTLGFASEFSAALDKEGWQAKEPLRIAPLPPITMQASDAVGVLIAGQVLPVGFDPNRIMPGTAVGTTYGGFLQQATSSGSLSYAKLGELLAAFYEADHGRPKQVSRDWILNTLASLSTAKELPAGFKARAEVPPAARLASGCALSDGATYFDLARALAAGHPAPTADTLAPLVALVKTHQPPSMDAPAPAQVQALRDAAYADVSITQPKRITVCAWLIAGLGDLLFAYRTAVALHDRFPNCSIELCYDANGGEIQIDQLGLDPTIAVRPVSLDATFFHKPTAGVAPPDVWVCAPMYYELTLRKPKFVKALMALDEDNRLTLDEYGRQSQTHWDEAPHRPDMFPGFASEDDGVFVDGAREALSVWRRRDDLAPHAQAIKSMSKPVRESLLRDLTPLTYMATHTLYSVYQKDTGQLALEHIARLEGARNRHIDVMLVGNYSRSQLAREALRLWPDTVIEYIEPLSPIPPVALRQPLDVKRRVRMFVFPRLSREDFAHLMRASARIAYTSGDQSFNEALSANKVAVYERFSHKTEHHQAWQARAPTYANTLAYDQEADRLPIDMAVPDKAMRRALIEDGLQALVTTPDLAARVANAVARKLTLQGDPALKAIDAKVTADDLEKPLAVLRTAIREKK